MVTYQTIMDRLGVTKTQIDMAMYSGIFPVNWADENNVEFYLKLWEERIARRRGKSGAINCTRSVQEV